MEEDLTHQITSREEIFASQVVRPVLCFSSKGKRYSPLSSENLLFFLRIWEVPSFSFFVSQCFAVYSCSHMVLTVEHRKIVFPFAVPLRLIFFIILCLDSPSSMT